MSLPFRPDHWRAFVDAPFVPQGPFGRRPASWAASHGIPSQGPELPADVLTRHQVRQECQDPGKPVLHGYICAMAWGLQGASRTGAHVSAAWASRARIECRLVRLRAGGLTRQEAYDLFADDPIPGLGPSYFTKLLYFFQPGTLDRFIMDQWTGKAINLLAGHQVVRMYGDAPNDRNTGQNYDIFCRVVEAIAARLGCTPDEAEQRLFSSGAQHRRQRGAWRAHVLERWSSDRPNQSYDHHAVAAWVLTL